MADDLKTTRSFWERPEGTTGMVALALGGVGLFFAAPALLAFMTTMVALLGQTIAVVVLCVVLGGLLSVISNKKFRTLVSYMFKSVMRKLTGWFVEIDPIGIMKSYIEDLMKKRSVMADSRDKLNGQIKVLTQKISSNEKAYNEAMQLAAISQKKGDQPNLTVNSRQAGRLEKLNKETYGPLLQQLQIHLRAVNKFYDVTGTMIADLKNEVEAQSTQRDMILSSYSAMSAAKKIIQGGTDEKELFDQALEFVANDFGMKLGEIDSFMESSRGFVDSLDMQNDVYKEDALKKLQEWENRVDSVVLGTGVKQQLLEAPATSVIPLNALPGVSTTDFSQLIARK
jgi:hypothetical protein